jgi:hypothetical protein
MCKDAYAATNHKDFQGQMIRFLRRGEAIRIQVNYLAHLNSRNLGNDDDLDELANQSAANGLSKEDTADSEDTGSLSYAKRANIICAEFAYLIDSFPDLDVVSPFV